MATVIPRLYENAETASKVAAALRAEDYRADEISIFADAGQADLAGAIKALHVSAGDAAIYADGVANGNALLVVTAPYGRGLKAMRIVDETASVPNDAKAKDIHVGVNVERTSNVISGGMLFFSGPSFPPLSRNALGFSKAFGMRTLSRGRRKISVMRGGRQMFPGETLSTWRLNTPLLKHNTRPLSNMMGWPTISHKDRSGIVMTDNPTPFSSWMGWSTISR